eukprot:s232_g16.t1
MAYQVAVQGRVDIMNGGGSIHLTPLVAAAPVPHPQSPRPTQAEIAEWSVHPSRTPVTREVINSAMCTVQKQLKLPTGLTGERTAEATARLRENLGKPKRGSQKQLAIEDKQPSPKRQKKSSSSSSSSSSGSSSSSSSDGPDRPRSRSPCRESGAETGAISPCSSGASTPKETLRGEIKELLEAIQVHQEIEKENEELKAEVEDLTPLIKVCDGLR